MISRREVLKAMEHRLRESEASAPGKSALVCWTEQLIAHPSYPQFSIR